MIKFNLEWLNLNAFKVIAFNSFHNVNGFRTSRVVPFKFEFQNK